MDSDQVLPRECVEGYAQALLGSSTIRSNPLSGTVLAEFLLAKTPLRSRELAARIAEQRQHGEVDSRLNSRIYTARKRIEKSLPGVLVKNGYGWHVANAPLRERRSPDPDILEFALENARRLARQRINEKGLGAKIGWSYEDLIKLELPENPFGFLEARKDGAPSPLNGSAGGEGKTEAATPAPPSSRRTLDPTADYYVNPTFRGGAALWGIPLRIIPPANGGDYDPETVERFKLVKGRVVVEWRDETGRVRKSPIYGKQLVPATKWKERMEKAGSPQGEQHTALEPDFIAQEYRRMEAVIRIIAKRIWERISLYRRTRFSLEDLIQEGTVGFLEAMRDYDPEYKSGANTKTFAEIRIKGAILDFLRRENLAYSRDEARKYRERKRVKAELTHNRMRAPSAGEMAEALGISLEEYRDAWEQMGYDIRHFSLDNLTGPEKGEGRPFLERVEDPHAPPSAELRLCDAGEAAMKMEAFHAAMRKLDPRLQRIVVDYLLKGKRMKEIGNDLELSEPRISQLFKKAFAALKDSLGGQF